MFFHILIRAGIESNQTSKSCLIGPISCFQIELFPRDRIDQFHLHSYCYNRFPITNRLTSDLYIPNGQNITQLRNFTITRNYSGIFIFKTKGILIGSLDRFLQNVILITFYIRQINILILDKASRVKNEVYLSAANVRLMASFNVSSNVVMKYH